MTWLYIICGSGSVYAIKNVISFILLDKTETLDMTTHGSPSGEQARGTIECLGWGFQSNLGGKKWKVPLLFWILPFVKHLHEAVCDFKYSAKFIKVKVHNSLLKKKEFRTTDSH